MKTLLRFLRRMWLRHDLWIWDTQMEEEQRRFDEFPARMASWRYQRALQKAEYDRLCGRTHVDYSYGPCMKLKGNSK